MTGGLCGTPEEFGSEGGDFSKDCATSTRGAGLWELLGLLIGLLLRRTRRTAQG